MHKEHRRHRQRTTPTCPQILLHIYRRAPRHSWTHLLRRGGRAWRRNHCHVVTCLGVRLFGHFPTFLVVRARATTLFFGKKQFLSHGRTPYFFFVKQNLFLDQKKNLPLANPVANKHTSCRRHNNIRNTDTFLRP